jgi:hypothetical protein
MSYCEDIELWEELPPPIHRVPNNLDSSSTMYYPNHTSHTSPSTRSRRSENTGSENSQVLYMAPPKSSRRNKRADRSLSSLSNGFDKRIARTVDEQTSKDDRTSPTRQLSWHVIDQKALEWQYGFQTSHPYWWSPELKCARPKKFQPGPLNEPTPYTSMGNTSGHSKPASTERRRAISDSYLANSKTVQGLAHLVAIQLLGACFTLLPDHLTSVQSPNCAVAPDRANIPDPQMISSLRLHTNSRYSPNYGYQMCNPSPILFWPGTFDGPSLSGNELSVNATPMSLGSSCAKLKWEYALTASDMMQKPPQDAQRKMSYEAIKSFSSETTFYPRHPIQDLNTGALKMPHTLDSGRRLKKKAYTLNLSKDEAIPTVQKGVNFVQSRNQPFSGSREIPQMAKKTPQKEIVKRLSRLRRRVGGSLNTEIVINVLENHSSASESSMRTAPDAVVRTSSSKRRRRAQEGGDTESSSVNDSPHYNSPMSGSLSPVNGDHNTPFRNSRYQSPASTFRVVEGLNSEGTLAPAKLHITTETTKYQQPPMLRHIEASGLMVLPRRVIPPAVSAITDASPEQIRSEKCHRSSLELSPTSTAPISPIPKRGASTKGRHRRKSMLSEICTPEDLFTSRVNGKPSWNEKSEKNSRSGSIDECHRPQFLRTSSSGTQIFTPAGDGIEIDGLPVGPSRETWTTRRKNGERTYL